MVLASSSPQLLPHQSISNAEKHQPATRLYYPENSRILLRRGKVSRAEGELTPDIVIKVARLWTHVKRKRVEDAVEIARKLLKSGWALIDIVEDENIEDTLRWFLYLVGDLGIKVKEVCTPANTPAKCVLFAKRVDVARIATAVNPKAVSKALNSGADLRKLILLRFAYIRIAEDIDQAVTLWFGAPTAEPKFCKQDLDTCIESVAKYIEQKLRQG